MSMAAPDDATVGLVLVSWNTRDLTLSCLEAVLAGDKVPDRILVFDNGSRDGSADAIADRFPSVEVVRNRHNAGFAAACNEGIRSLLQAGCRFAWLLNTDTRVERACLARLVDTLVHGPEFGVVTAKILRSEPPGTIWYAGGSLDRRTCEPVHRGSWEPDRGQYDAEADTLFVSGCCMLIRKAALDSAGLFDERYLAYFEDADWCLRANAAGVRLRYQPRAVLCHVEHASIDSNKPPALRGTVSPAFIYLYFRNHLFLILGHAHGRERWAPLATVLRRAMRVGGKLLVLGRWGKLHCLLRGLHDGWRGVTRWQAACVPGAR